MRATVVALSAVVAAICAGCQRAPSDTVAPVRGDLLSSVQTYCMVPVLPETAAALHVTVNGVWGGIGGTDPVLTHRDTVPAVQGTYGNDAAAFAAACHRAGLFVCGVINGLEGFPTMRAQWPDLESMACRDALGAPAHLGDGMLLMCTNNPDWQRWELDCGKRGIDLGADLLLVDTPMSAPFVSGFLKAGFCDFCMANFRTHLERDFSPEQRLERFGLTDLSASAIVPRLSPLQDLANPKMRPFHNTGKDDLLFREFIRCQEQASFDTRKSLTDALRAYAKAAGRDVALATNASDLGTVNPGGHWIRALMYADLFDQFIYEQNVEPSGMPSDDLMRYPRGRWAAYHKLAYAIHHRRAPAVIHAGAMGRILMDVLTAGKTVNTWMEVQSAEAYAANGAYVQYYVEPRAAKQVLLSKCWAGSARHAAFVQSHRDLYEGDLRSGSPLALLFLLNERGRTIPAVCPSYLGFAEALTEGNYPFDVVFAGDGHYVRDRLTATDLEPYRTVLIPSPVAPTDTQKRVVQGFVRGGGTVLCQEPEALGLTAGTAETDGTLPAFVVRRFGYGDGRVWVISGKVSETWTDDIGANFLRSYAPELRTAICQLVDAVGAASLTPDDTSGLVTVFPLVQPEEGRLVVHLVNCDIDDTADSIREKTNVALNIPLPAFLRGRLVASLITPETAPAALAVTRPDANISVTVPRLGIYAAVVITPQQDP